MSYILDALKKSEEERQRGEVPGLQTIQTNAALKPLKRSYWPYVLMTALLLNAGVFLWWMLPLQPHKTLNTSPSTTPPQLAQKVEQPEGTVNQPPSSTQIVSPAPAKSNEMKSNDGGTSPGGVVRTATVAPPQERITPRPQEKPEAEPSGGSNKTFSKPEVQSRPPKASVPAPSLGRQESIPSSTARQSIKEESPKALEASAKGGATLAIAPPATSGTMEGKRDKRTKEKMPLASPKFESEKSSTPEYPKELLEALLNSKEKAPASRSPSAPAPAAPNPRLSAEAGTEPGVPTLRDLPLDVQLKVPKMSFSVFVYSQKPADRMVIIDGRTRREGDEVSSGLKLDEITREGAIFSFKGHRFLQRVF